MEKILRLMKKKMNNIVNKLSKYMPYKPYKRSDQNIVQRFDRGSSEQKNNFAIDPNAKAVMELITVLSDGLKNAKIFSDFPGEKEVIEPDEEETYILFVKFIKDNVVDPDGFLPKNKDIIREVGISDRKLRIFKKRALEEGIIEWLNDRQLILSKSI